MILIVGLGNPGKKYENTRHNLGFRVINELKFLKNKKIVLVKPKTFMNDSGRAVKTIIENLKLKINNLIVIHDDLDLPLGKIKISVNRGSAGHKGIESIIKELKTKNFIRFRIGICPQSGKPKNPENFVLKNFTKKEEEIIKEVIKKTIEAIGFSLGGGIEGAMNKYN